MEKEQEKKKELEGEQLEQVTGGFNTSLVTCIVCGKTFNVLKERAEYMKHIETCRYKQNQVQR